MSQRHYKLVPLCVLVCQIRVEAEMLNGPGAAKAVAAISVLTLKWLSCQGVPLVGAPPCS